MIIEFYRRWLRDDYHGDIEAMERDGCYFDWTPERIKQAFKSGHGTEEDLRKYMENNKCYCIFKEVSWSDESDEERTNECIR